jgi:hypothetical protein
MTFGEHVFLYCERGTSEALLAEPLNALSNFVFLVAALVGLQLVLWRPAEERSADQVLLCALVFLIGLGSLAFHLFATQGTELFDVVPISVFMLVYLGFALNRFLGVPPGFVVLLVIGFTAVMAFTMQVKCGEGAIGFLGSDMQSAKPCLNGSLLYLPALGALIVVGLILHERGQSAAPWFLWAAAILAVSITLRSLDLALCDKALIEGRKVGTHFAWHVLNALALFLLLRASLEGGPSSVTRVTTKPPLGEAAEAQGVAPVETVPAADTEAPTPLAEGVAPAAQEAAKEDEASDEEGERKSFFPA